MNTKTIFLSAIVVIAGCQVASNSVDLNTSNSAKMSNPIKTIKGLQLKKHYFTINPKKEQTIALPSGSKLEIPANAFVDADGKPIHKNVTIGWNEYHTLSDIMLSGIPMRYDSAGVSGDFVSGGMFEINAKSNQEDVFLADDKKINVDIASINDTPCMNFYKLDETTGKWDYITTEKAIATDQSTPINETITQSSNTNPSPKATSRTIIDAHLNTSAFPQLATNQIIGWQTNNCLNYKEQNYIRDEHSKMNLTQQINDTLFALHISNSKLKIDTVFNVSPYGLKDALEKTKKLDDEYQASLAEQNKIASANNIRSIEIGGMGVYNWDIVCSRKDPVQFIADFDFPKKINPNDAAVFLISPEENCVVRYDPENYDKFSYNPHVKSCIVAILPDNSVAYCSNDDIKASKGVQPKEVYTFSLRKSTFRLKNSRDLEKYLADLI